MQFSDITKSIHDGLKFSWPPIFLSGSTLLICNWLNSNLTESLLKNLLLNLKDFGLKVNEIKAILDMFGLMPVIPLISMVIVIAFLYLINGPIFKIFAWLPPWLYFRPDLLIGRRLSNRDRLLILRKYPAAVNFSQAYSHLIQENQRVEENPWHSAMHFCYTIQCFIKAIFVFVLAFLVYDMYLGTPFLHYGFKIIIFFLVAPIFLLIFMAGQLYYQELMLWYEWDYVFRSFKTPELESQTIQFVGNEESKVYVNLSKKWWIVRFTRPGIYDWLKRTFY